MVIQQKNTSISDKIITYIIIQPDDPTEGRIILIDIIPDFIQGK